MIPTLYTNVSTSYFKLAQQVSVSSIDESKEFLREAESYSRNALEIIEGHLKARYRLSQVLLEQGNLQAAFDNLKIVQDNPAPESADTEYKAKYGECISFLEEIRGAMEISEHPSSDEQEASILCEIQNNILQRETGEKSQLPQTIAPAKKIDSRPHGKVEICLDPLGLVKQPGKDTNLDKEIPRDGHKVSERQKNYLRHTLIKLVAIPQKMPKIYKKVNRAQRR